MCLPLSLPVLLIPFSPNGTPSLLSLWAVPLLISNIIIHSFDLFSAKAEGKLSDGFEPSFTDYKSAVLNQTIRREQKKIGNHTTRTIAQSPIEEEYNMNMYYKKCLHFYILCLKTPSPHLRFYIFHRHIWYSFACWT